MIAYFDTSAVVPLLVAEETSPVCRQLWTAADDVVLTRLVHVEASAALASAERIGRLVPAAAEAARSLLDALWEQVLVLELDEQLMGASSAAARRFALRGYDAVHCAAAAQLQEAAFVAVSGDRQLLAAWSQLGLSTADTAVSPRS